jgi:CII-binding regulator of phage lambda lysogenization HflD
MPTVEERVAYLEGRLEDHTEAVGTFRQDMSDLRSQITHLDQDLRSQIANLDQKVDRFFSHLDSKISRHFIWTVGIQVAVLLAVIGALASR